MTPFIAGILFGIVTGVVATALCLAKEDPEPTQRSDPHEQRDADKY